MTSLRFIHAAELTLGQPLEGLGLAEAAQATRLRDVTTQAFERIVQLCLDRQVDALLIAGDVYDVAERPLGAHLHLIDGLERLDTAGIRVCIAPGARSRPDEWARGLPWPANVHIFGERPETIALDADGAVTLTGLSQPGGMPDQRLLSGLARKQEAAVAVALLPTNLDDAEAGWLKRPGIEYWALGGRRSRRVYRAAAPTIIDPGPPQGLHAGEPGPRGVYYVELDEGQPQLEFISTAVVRWERIALTVDELDWPEGVIQAAVRQIGALALEPHEELFCELALIGHWPLARIPADTETLRQTVRLVNDELRAVAGQRTCTHVTRRLRPSPARAERRTTSDPFAELLGVFDELRDHPPAAAEAFRQRIDELASDPRMARHIAELRLTSEETRWAALDLAEGLATTGTAERS